MSKRGKKSQAVAAARAGANARPSGSDGGARFDWRFAWIAAAVIAVAVVAVYGGALDSPFIFDDYHGIVTNESIDSLWPLVGDATNPGPLNPPPFIPTSARPLVNLSLALNYAIGGLNPTGYHVFNVVVHILCTMLLWSITRRTLRLPVFGGHFEGAADWLALAVAMLWALHPLQTEAVLYATQRTELMMALFYLATLDCSMRYWAALALVSGEGQSTLPLPPGEGRGEGAASQTTTSATAQRAVWLSLATLACLGGMASKEVMASAPLVVLLFERTFVAGSLPKALRHSWPLYVGLSCGWLLIIWLNVGSPHSDAAGFHLGVPAYVWWFTQAKILLMYLKLAVWPSPLLIHYELPYLRTLASAWMVLLPIAMLGFSTLWLLWRNRPTGFLGTWIFAILSPTLLIPITTEMAAERRMYLPLAALVIFAVVGGYELAQWAYNWAARRGRLGPLTQSPLASVGTAAVILAIVFSVASAERLASYRDELILWQEVLRLQPRNHMAQENVGVQLQKAGHMEAAMERYREAIRLKPDSVPAHYNLGLALLKVGKPEEAIAPFRDAARLKPGSAPLRNNIGVALMTAGQFEEAIEVFHQVLALKPDMWRAHDNLGMALKRSGRFEEAIHHYKLAIKHHPKGLEIYGHLADAYAHANQPEKAFATAERALALARASGNETTAQRITTQLKSFRARQTDKAVDGVTKTNHGAESGSRSN